MKEHTRHSVLIAASALIGTLLVVTQAFPLLLPGVSVPTAHASIAATVSSLFVYTFNSDGVLQEASNGANSSSPYWWLNSGGYVFFAEKVGKTVQGALGLLDPWRLRYAISNPTDTDNGAHPQNIFRLVTRSLWRNARQSVYVLIARDNLSSSPNRNASNGILLFNRYLNGDNLYYTGVRVDGAVVVKKKKNGNYYTIAYKKIFPGTYHRTTRPNLLPKNMWMGIQSEVRTLANGTVEIRVFTDVGRTGTWSLALTAIDDGKSFGGSPILSEGYGGIRTDFMDVRFESYRMQAL